MVSLPRRKLALVVEYDGTRYSGFQFQRGASTIQGDIEGTLKKIAGERIRIVGAGRTDAGVHAKGQVVSFGSFSTLPARTLIKALNFYLRPDIAVKAVYEAGDDFHARRDALSREYRYRILNGPTPSPLEQRYAYYVPIPLNVGAMSDVCKCLEGTHDFASFTGPTERRTVREVYKAEILQDGEFLFFDMIANSFLNKQVRCTVGMMIRVGTGRLTVEEFKKIKDAKQPGLAAPVVAPHALYLMKVNYPENIFKKGS
jgi:tRNA pseudouridine38-40 synthase